MILLNFQQLNYMFDKIFIISYFELSNNICQKRKKYSSLKKDQKQENQHM